MGSGEVIRAARREKGLTLIELGKMCQMTPSKLSRVENGQSQLSVTQLMQLSEALETPFATLAAHEPSADGHGPSVVTRAGEGRFFEAPHCNFEALCTEGASVGSFFWVTEITQKPGDELSYRSHPGLEFMYVLSGNLTLVFKDSEQIDLAPGDAVKFDSSRAHTYVTRSPMQARVLMMNAPS
jgi:transcriptional regulator with XRE-family HTH domain